MDIQDGSILNRLKISSKNTLIFSEMCSDLKSTIIKQCFWNDYSLCYKKKGCENDFPYRIVIYSSPGYYHDVTEKDFVSASIECETDFIDEHTLTKYIIEDMPLNEFLEYCLDKFRPMEESDNG